MRAQFVSSSRPGQQVPNYGMILQSSLSSSCGCSFWSIVSFASFSCSDYNHIQPKRLDNNSLSVCPIGGLNDSYLDNTESVKEKVSNPIRRK